MHQIKEFLVSAYDYPYQEEDDEILIQKYSCQDITNLIEIAKKENLVLLRFIALDAKTYFNQKQVFEIMRNELPALRANATINKNLLDAIVRIADCVIHEGYSFLKFEPSDRENKHVI